MGFCAVCGAGLWLALLSLSRVDEPRYPEDGCVPVLDADELFTVVRPENDSL